MPRVLRIINRFNLGGPTYNVAYLTRYLEPEFETLLIGGQKDDSEESSEFIVQEMGIKPVIIPEMKRSINPINDFIAYRKIRKIILEFRPDVVHTHAAKAGTIGRLAAFSCKVPVVMHTFHGHVFHSYFGKFKTAIYKLIERYLAKRSSLIIAVSEKQRQELANTHKICDFKKIEVVPLGFNLEKFRTNTAEKRKKFRDKYRISEDEVAIAIIGRLVPVKNHVLFLEVLSSLQFKTNRKIRAFIVGDGEERKALEQRAGKLNILYVDYNLKQDKALLTFTSWIKDISEVLAGIDIVALTSFNEGTPVSLIEAQAAGKAIVTTNVGGVEDVIAVNQTAFLSSGEVNDFVAKLLLLVEDDALRIRMGSTGWENVKNKFHYSRLVEDIRNIYKRELKNTVISK